LQEIVSFEAQDGLFDCTWSEENENIICAGSGDGSIKLWDTQSRIPRPICAFREHEKEVYAVDWNLVAKGSFEMVLWLMFDWLPMSLTIAMHRRYVSERVMGLSHQTLDTAIESIDRNL
jgi:WD40 repeat protein